MKEFGKNVRPAETNVRLPKYSDEAFQKLVRATPPDYISGNEVDWRARKVLDRVSFFWRESDEIRGRISRMGRSTELPGIFPLERGLARKFYAVAQDATNQAVISLDLALIPEKPEWENVYDISNKVKSIAKEKPFHDQTIAVCEAISETREMNLKASEVRQRVAQGCWRELINMIPYARLDENKETTRDDLESEKAEIKEAIQDKPWGETATKEAEREYEDYLKQMKKNKFKKSLISEFKKLYNATKGKGLRRQSVFNILSTQENILNGLYREGALKTP